MILGRFDPLSCSLERAYSCLHARFLMNKTKDQISWVSSHDLYWKNKMYKRKRSICGESHFICKVMKWHFCVFLFFITIHMCLQTREPESADLVSKEKKCRVRNAVILPLKQVYLYTIQGTFSQFLQPFFLFCCLFSRDKQGVPKTMIAFEVFVQQIDDFNFRELLLVYFEFRLSSCFLPAMFFYLS